MKLNIVINYMSAYEIIKLANHRNVKGRIEILW